MNDHPACPDVFPCPIARRVAAGAISVTAMQPFSMVLTDAEAEALIQQLQVARAMPAPALDADAQA